MANNIPLCLRLYPLVCIHWYAAFAPAEERRDLRRAQFTVRQAHCECEVIDQPMEWVGEAKVDAHVG